MIGYFDRLDLNCGFFSVYDYNEMSWQNLLNRFFDKINEIIEEVNSWEDVFEFLKTEGIKKEVIEQLEKWLGDGTLSQLINEDLFFELNAKINSHGKNIIDYRMYNTEPEYWDGAIKQALLENNVVLFPKGTFKFRDRIIINGYYKSIKGLGEGLGGDTVFEFENNDGYFITSGSRYCSIKNIRNEKLCVSCGGKTGIGIRFGFNGESSDNTINSCSFENLSFNGFESFIATNSNIDNTNNKSILWNCIFRNIRADHCDNGIKMVDTGFISFNNTFEQVYINGSKNVLELRSMQCNFINCNFGITQLKAFTVDNNSYIKFDGCNFECDKKVDGTGNIFNAYAKNVEFDNCIFAPWTSSTVSFFGVYSTLLDLSLKNIRYNNHDGSEMINFWSSSNCDTAHLGSVKFLSGTNLVPRPSNWGGIYSSRYMDCNKPILVDYNTENNSHSTQGLKPREFAFSNKDKIPVVNNGEVITDFLGNPIVNETNVYKLAPQIYMEKGRVEVGTGEQLITIHYKRKKKGSVFFTPPTFFDGISPKKYKIQVDTSNNYFDNDNYCVIRAFEWNESSKDWDKNITEGFIVDWFKISN